MRLSNRSKTLVAILLLAACLLTTATAQAKPPAQDNPVPIYIFWGDGCPHCAKAMDYLLSLQMEYPAIEIKDYEIYFEPENLDIFTGIAEKYGFEPSSVPTIFIGSQYFVGFSDSYKEQIKELAIQCMDQGCPDPGGGVVVSYPPVFEDATATLKAPTATQPPTAIYTAVLVTLPAATLTEAPSQTPDIPATPTAQSSPTPAIGAAVVSTHDDDGHNSKNTLNIPLIGSVSLDEQSATLSTLLIAFVDGFNPCSIWVLTMLLALTLHSGSRRRVLLIGLVFLTVTAAIYALFIAGLFSILQMVQFMGWVQAVTALVALVFGIINIKDYFWYKEGVSLTIADDKKPGIYKHMRAVVDASQSTWGLIGATIVLAAGVSLVEFSCTAGFPVLWVNLLTAQQVGTVSFVFLLLLYMLIYQIDELAIFFTAVFSLKASRLEEKHGRLLKLVGGVLMLSLAAVMLIDPSLMNSLDTSLLVFAGSFIATLVVLLVHRVILPYFFNVWIGSETSKK